MKKASSLTLKNSKVPPILGLETLGEKELFKVSLKSRLGEGSYMDVRFYRDMLLEEKPRFVEEEIKAQKKNPVWI